VESLTCRLLPDATADGPRNMAADEAMLESARGGSAALRFYGWSEPTASLGYFQPVAARDNDRRLAKLPFVRRPTGGSAIVHHFELTYAFALPPGLLWQGREPWLPRMHGIIAKALVSLGVPAQLHCATESGPGRTPLCFQCLLAGDVVLGESKIVGSAQRRTRGALLQHGSILLMVSSFAPLLAGIHELSGHSLTAPPIREAIVTEFTCQTGWCLEPADWTDAERRRMKELILTKYTHDTWNRKR
jgi:lipoate-protein ligase A